ncbi:bifunctional phosphopantothenoylcysteine decarboxylase/phosphopantothenate--cysteine ligase CoaBC [Candidatus Saganbacteria bacterium]|nr:bifunctional phosphopantothenoylcysteine decarboxylase/phosphopantothenate--cysteine ligase CoaBC [Candidatus Saganbacteria bacterium]
MLKGKTIIVGVTGGIAAFKACDLVSTLKKLEAEVWVVMTRSAREFVTPLTLRTLSQNPVITELFSEDEYKKPVPHVSLAEKADLIIIAPATANLIGKIAGGIADDALTTTIMTAKCPKLLAPAMNTNMWENPIVQKNLDALKSLGYHFVGPIEGRLACGTVGLGKMAEIAKIIRKAEGLFTKEVKSADLSGMKILITAGATREAIDPIRFISNRSSGKMGYAIATAAQARGAEVTLITGPTGLPHPPGVKVIEVQTAEEMREEVMKHRPGQKAIIMAAAVADYRPAVTFWQKFKKDGESYNLELLKTADILAELGKLKNGSYLIGFAAETNNHLENAKEKLERKNLDLIVVNDAAAFEAEESEVHLIERSGSVTPLPRQKKHLTAHQILDAILRL